MKFLIVMAFFSLFSREINTNDPEEIVGEIIEKTVQYAQKKYPIVACGIGMSMPDGIVEKLTLCFYTKYTLSKDQLRLILLDLGREQIHQINSNQYIQRFLFKKPFTIYEARIIIYNKDKFGEESYYPFIANAQIGLNPGVITFRTTDRQNPYRSKEHLDETYEEVLKIISEQQNSSKNNKPQNDCP